MKLALGENGLLFRKGPLSLMPAFLMDECMAT